MSKPPDGDGLLATELAMPMI
ncbi:hypothetical protein TNIN_336801, partial [Trichonephila inaurata madagascariensis]